MKKHPIYWEDIKDFFRRIYKIVSFLFLCFIGLLGILSFLSLIFRVFFPSEFKENLPEIRYYCRTSEAIIEYDPQGNIQTIRPMTPEEKQQDLQEYADCLKKTIDDYNNSLTP